MKCYKGFDKDLKCRGFQFELGGEYEEPKADLCSKGFHACVNPLDVFSYYSPSDSRYCEVELEEVSEQRDADSKICGKRIKIGAEIGLKGIVEAALNSYLIKLIGRTLKYQIRATNQWLPTRATIQRLPTQATDQLQKYQVKIVLL